MPEYITLLGTEDVRRASSSMQAAADDMRRAAASIEESLQRHRIFLDQWLAQFEEALKAVNEGA